MNHKTINAFLWGLYGGLLAGGLIALDPRLSLCSAVVAIMGAIINLPKRGEVA